MKKVKFSILLLLGAVYALSSVAEEGENKGLFGVQCSTLVGAPNDPTIGGGSLYVDAGGGMSVSAMIASNVIIVRTIAELRSAIETAEEGQTIFIPSDVTMDFSNEPPIFISKRIILAGDRGIGGAKGALLTSSTYQFNKAMFEISNADEVRITGLRLQGPHRYPSQGVDTYAIRASAIENLRIDNMALFNWSLASVRLNAGTNARVHHNIIYDNAEKSTGYGVALYGDSRAIIDHNIFDGNRHSIAGNGASGQAYMAHSNIVLSNGINHAFDMHAFIESDSSDGSDSLLAGEKVVICNNTFLIGGAAVTIRGMPTASAYIGYNKFSHHEDSHQSVIQKILVPGGSARYNTGSVDKPYQEGFVVENNLYSQHGNLRYGNFETTVASSAVVGNDVFWLVPGSDISSDGLALNDWYVSRDGNQPWRRLSSSTFPLSRLSLGDFDGDGTSDIFHGGDGVWEMSSKGVSNWQPLNSSRAKMCDLALADIDGDGLSDVIHKRTGSVSLGGDRSWNSDLLSSQVSSSQNLLFVDMGLDKQTDLVRVNARKFEVSWGGQTVFTVIPEGQGNRAFIRNNLGYGDFNGDGKVDVFRVEADSWQVRWYGSSGFSVLSGGHDNNLDDLAFGDFNGDGKTDIFRIKEGAWQYSSAGTGDWQHLRTPTDATLIPVTQLAFGDFNGDGKTDVFTGGGHGNSSMRISWGGSREWARLNSTSREFSKFIFADVNADGRTDIAYIANGKVIVSLSAYEHWRVWDTVQFDVCKASPVIDSIAAPDVDRRSVAIRVAASDSDGDLTKVELKIANGPWLEAESADPWLFMRQGLSNGSHGFEVRALDDEGLVSKVESGTFDVNYTCIYATNWAHFTASPQRALLQGVPLKFKAVGSGRTLGPLSEWSDKTSLEKVSPGQWGLVAACD